MSLRARIVALIGAVLLFSMAMGTLVAGYQTRHALNAELAAGLGGAQQTVNSALEDLPKSDHPARDLRQLIATFDGNRHVRAALLTARGQLAGMSTTRSTDRPAPGWFRSLLGPAPESIAIDLPAPTPGYRRIVLTPTPDIDVTAAWREFIGVMLVLSGSAAIGLVLVYVVISAAFRPLRLLAAQFARVGAGDYGGRVVEEGPSELTSLQRGFNRMAAELTASTERNRVLGDQLLTIQEEERADIARDLHDDIGPHLFAVNMDAEMISQLSEAGRHDRIKDQARSIQAAVGHMQRQVRDLLGRLRPIRVTELGLNAAILDLVRFWRERRPDIAFDLRLREAESEVPEAAKEIAYRVVQEAVNNAVRHGDPQSIRIAFKVDDGQILTLSVTDDGAGPKAETTAGGLGLIGMRERVTAAGGSLAFGPNEGAPGWTTVARLSLDASPATPRTASVLA
jgi:two-component system sensor histidine kinase UhpB